ARIASRVHRSAAVLAAGASTVGGVLVHDTFFDTVALRTDDAEAVVRRARDAGYLLRQEDDVVVVALDETTTPEDLAAVLGAFGWDGDLDALDALDRQADDAIPPDLRRTSPFRTHPSFHRF